MSRVSIVIPSYNNAAFIVETIESLLAQTYDDLSIVVVDDRSQDDTVSIVQSIHDPRLRVIENEKNLGAAGNWNNALSYIDSDAEYFKLVCGDDLLHATCIERQVAALDEHPSAVVACSARRIVDANGKTLFAKRGLAGLRGLVPAQSALRTIVQSGTNPLGEPAGSLFRTSVLQHVSGYDPNHSYMIDIDFVARALAHGDLVATPEALASFRVHALSWSNRIGRRQAREAGDFFEQLHRDHPKAVRRQDVVRGKAIAIASGIARQFVYVCMRLRDSMISRTTSTL